MVENDVGLAQSGTSGKTFRRCKTIPLIDLGGTSLHVFVPQAMAWENNKLALVYLNWVTGSLYSLSKQ